MQGFEWKHSGDLLQKVSFSGLKKKRTTDHRERTSVIMPQKISLLLPLEILHAEVIKNFKYSEVQLYMFRAKNTLSV